MTRLTRSLHNSATGRYTTPLPLTAYGRDSRLAPRVLYGGDWTDHLLPTYILAGARAARELARARPRGLHLAPSRRVSAAGARACRPRLPGE